MKRQRRLLFALASSIVMSASAATEDLRIQEFVLSVSSIENVLPAFTDVLKWEVMHEGAADPTAVRVWDLDVDTPVHEVLVGNPGSERGFVRLVEFTSQPRELIRPGARWWDTGGTFNMNVLVRDLDQTVAGLRKLGWTSRTVPSSYQVGDKVSGKSMIMVGPDDLVLSFQEREKPPLTGWPPFSGASHIEVGYQIVSDVGAWADFFSNQLGWPTSKVSEQTSSKPVGPNDYGLPHNATGLTDRRGASVALPEGGKQSLVAREHLAATGFAYSERARPPNLGIASIRIGVGDVLATSARLAELGFNPVSAPQILRVSPYGTSRVMAVTVPGGSGQWLELIEIGVEAASKDELAAFFQGGRFANWVRFNNQMTGTVEHRADGSAHVTWKTGLSEAGIWTLKGNTICTAWHRLRDFREQCAYYYRIGPSAYQSFTVDGRPDGLLFWE